MVSLLLVAWGGHEKPMRDSASRNSVCENHFHMQLLFSPSSCPVLITLFKYAQLRMFLSKYTQVRVLSTYHKRSVL